MEEKITKLILAVRELTKKSKKYCADLEYLPRYQKIQVGIRDVNNFDCIENISIYFDNTTEQLDKVIEHIKNFENDTEE